MKKILKKMCAVAMAVSVLSIVGCGSGGTVYEAPSFKRITVFGDGMVDAGQTGKRYTVNDTRAEPVFKTWPEYFEQALGREMKPSSAGGTNYAKGGTTISGAGGFAEQVAARGGRFDKDDAVVVGAGLQDIKAQVELVKNGKSLAAAKADLDKVANSYLKVTDQLIGNGAKVLVLSTSHDLGKTKWASDNNVSDTATQLSQYFQDSVYFMAQDRYTGTSQRAAVRFLKIADGPTTKGLFRALKTDKPLCTGAGETDVLQCTDKTLVTDVETEQNGYLLADHIYLSPVAHRILADEMRKLYDSMR